MKNQNAKQTPAATRATAYAYEAAVIKLIGIDNWADHRRVAKWLHEIARHLRIQGGR